MKPLIEQLCEASGVTDTQLAKLITRAMPNISARLLQHARPGVVLCIVGVNNLVTAEALAARFREESLSAEVEKGCCFNSPQVHVSWSPVESYIYSNADFYLDGNLNIVEAKQ